MHIGRKWLIAFEVVNKSSPRWACDSCLRKIRYNKLPFLHSYIQLHRIDWNLQKNVQFEYLWHLYWSVSSMAKGFIEFPLRVAFCVTGKLRCTLIHLNVYASESDCIQRRKMDSRDWNLVRNPLNRKWFVCIVYTWIYTWFPVQKTKHSWIHARIDHELCFHL